MATSRKRKASDRRKTRPEHVDTRPRPVASLRLTAADAVHMRDLFGIVLPPDGSRTVSQSLATATGRSIVESRLWHKLQQVCVELGVPLGDAAPDFVVVPTSVPMPELAVQRFDAAGQEADPGAPPDPSAFLDVVLEQAEPSPETPSSSKKRSR